jgi:proline racemase
MRTNRVLHLISAHNEGMRGDVVVGGLPAVPGDTVRDKMLYFQDNLDHLRKLCVMEPRAVGTPVNFVVPSNHPDADFGYIIALATEYVAMSGSNTMCVATVLLETGMIPMQEPITEFALEAPMGIIHVRAECKDGKVLSTSFLNQPAFVAHHQQPVDVPGIGTIPVDVAWGGMTYAIVDAESLGFKIVMDEAKQLVEVGQRIKKAAHEQLGFSHPLEPRFNGITQTLMAGPLREVDGEVRSRNTVVVTPGGLDRCPCGTGTSARLALLHARGELQVGQTFRHEGILGTAFTASIDDRSTVGDLPAVLPRVAGQSWITSVQQVFTDPTDPFPEGFALRDIWPADPVLKRVE